MKRVLAVLLCLLCALLLLVACGDDPVDTDSSQGSGNNTDNQGHTHTYKTNAEWSKDAQGHWYDPTCDCEDAPITKLNHTDANNDGACDVCTYTNHEHEYSEDWTADCTNHWNAADCGHTVAGTNVAPHADNDSDGVCDTCKYVIEDLHEHIYSTEWTYGDGYHWHAALCEHKVEVADKAACNVNAAGVCTVCDAKIKDVDKTDILAILQAAVANNFKVISGTVVAGEQAFEGSTVEVGKSNQVFFILGNGDSFVKWGSYDKAGNFIGVDEYWFQTISEGEIFGVQMPYYHPNTGERNDQLTLFPVSGDSDKLNGYTYIPGAILAAGYEDNTTLAQTLANLFDIMQKGENVLDAVSNYDAETGKYTFSYDYFFVSETKGNTAQDGSGEEIISYAVEYFEVDVTFTVNSDYVVNFAEFTVKSYRNLEGIDNDISYDPTTNTVTFLAAADPTVYSYQVSQTSGERTYTSIYPKASLLPVDFELSFVTGTDYNDAGQMYVTSETPIVDIDGDGIGDLELTKETFIRLHIGSVIPASALPSFMNMDDMEVTCENLDDGTGLLWGTGLFQDPTYSGFMDCISFRTAKNSGKFLVTIRFGQVTKKICVTIPGTPTVVIPDDTADTKYVYVSSVNGWEDEYTYTAKESGKYTFTLPAGLGFAFKDADTPEYDPFNPADADNNEHTVEFTLAKGESVTFLVGAEKKAVFAIGVAFEAVATPDPEPEPDPTPDVPVIAESPLTANGNNAVNGASKAFAYIAESNGKLTIKYNAFVMGKPDDYVVYSINGGTPVTVVAGGVDNVITLNANDKIVISVITNGYTTIISAWEGEAVDGGDEEPSVTLNGSGTDADPYVIPEAGDYVCAFPGQADVVWYKYTVVGGGYVTVSTTFGNGGWIKLGTSVSTAASNEGSGETLSAYFPAGSVVYIGIGDYAEGTVDVPFKVAYEAFTSEAIDAIVGSWSGKGTTMWGAEVTYKLTINADGTGVLVYNDGFGDTENTVDYVVKKGNDITIGYTGSWSAGSLACAYENDTFTCTSGLYNESFVFTVGGGAGDIEEDKPEYDTVIVEGANTLYFSADEIAADTATRPLTITADGKYSLNAGALFISAITDANGNVITKNDDYTYNLVAGSYTVTFKMLSMFGVQADTAQELNVVFKEELGTDEPEIPVTGGTFDNPYDLDAENTLSYAGGMNYVWYAYTAGEAGTLTVTMTSADFFWAYGMDEYALETMATTPSAEIKLAAGEVVYIGVSTNSQKAAEITFTSSFVPSGSGAVVEQGTSTNPFDLEASNSCDFPGGMDYVFYKYTAAEDGTLTITFITTDNYWAYGAAPDALKDMGGKDTGDIALKAGEVVYIGISTYSTNAKVVDFTSSFAAASVEEEEKITQADLVFGNNSVNAADIAFNYTAAADIDIKVTVGSAVMGAVTVTYSVNGGDEITLAASTETEIALKAGDVLKITAKTTSGYLTIKAEEVAHVVEPNGTSTNPYIIDALPYDIVLTGKHDKFYQFTATEDATIVVSFPAGCYVSGLPSSAVKDEAALTYTFDVKAGDVITINPWTNNTTGDFTYTVKVAEPVEEEPGEGGGNQGGEEQGISGTYIGAGNGRGMKIVIDTAADTLVITRASSGSLTNFDGGTTYTLVYSEILASAVDGVVPGFISGTSIMNLTFNSDGTVSQLTWNGAVYKDYVKQ